MIQTTKPNFQKNTKDHHNENNGGKLGDGVLNAIGEMHHVTDNLLKTIEEMKESTKTQTAGVKEITATITSIGSAVQQIANSTQNALQKVQESERFASKSSQEIEKGMNSMNSIKDIVGKSFESVSSLSDDLSKIDEIVEFITHMSEQSNMLALNAAIEAARAGEAGRGFAVVADEVRRLSEKSKGGAIQIAKLIKILQTSSNDTTAKIQEGTKIVSESVIMITGVLDSLKTISQSVKDISVQIQEISAATEEVSASSEQATAASEEIRSIAETNLENFENMVNSKNNDSSLDLIVKSANESANILVEITDVLNSSTIVSITDTGGDINYMNPYFIEVSKYGYEELIGQNHRILKSGFHSPALWDALWKTISGGKTFSGYVRNKAKDGTIYWVKTVISPTLDKDGNIKGYVGVRTPITELMVMTGIEDAIRQAEKGKKINIKMKKIIENLRVGNYTVNPNY